MDMEAGLDAAGNVVAWSGDFYIALNHIVAFKPLDFPLLAATETGIPRPGNWVGFLFQNSGQPFQIPNIKVNTRHIAEAPKVEIALIDRLGTPAWVAGEPMACAIPGAIANAVFDATGVRLRSLPFTLDKVKAALAAGPKPA